MRFHINVRSCALLVSFAEDFHAKIMATQYKYRMDSPLKKTKQQVCGSYFPKQIYTL